MSQTLPSGIVNSQASTAEPQADAGEKPDLEAASIPEELEGEDQIVPNAKDEAISSSLEQAEVMTSVVHPAPAQQPLELPTTSKTPSRSRGLPILPVVLAASVLLSTWLLRRLRSRRGAAAQSPVVSEPTQAADLPAPPPPEPVEPDSLEIMVCSPPPDLSLSASRNTGSLPQSLGRVTFVVSEDVDLAATPTTLGAPAAVLTEHAASSSSAVVKLLEAGAVCLGKVAIQPLGLDILGANFGNPYNKAHVSGGGQTGAAAAVSTGVAQLAVCSDLLGSARIPAACCGVYCYRSSPGAVGPVNAVAAAAGAKQPQRPPPPLEALSVMAADPGVLLKAAHVLKAPGSFDLRGEIVRFVVAEDLFASCAVEYQPAGLAIKRAILKWAGSEQAGAVQLCKFLADNSAGWQTLTPDDVVGAIGGLPPGLTAWATAGRILQAAQLHEKLPELSKQQQQPNKEAAAASDEGAGEGDMAEEKASEEEAAEAAARAEAAAEGETEEAAAREGDASGSAAVRQTEGQQAEAATEERDGMQAGQSLQLPLQPSAERLAAAEEVARQLYDTLRHTVKPDTVIVLPVVPTAPMRRRAAAAAAAAANPGVPPNAAADPAVLEARAFESLSYCFNCLASLAQCPVVIVPLGTVADGTPLAAALMGCSRFDARLIAVAAKMGPVMREAFDQVKEGLAEAVRQQEQERAAAPPAASAAAAPPPPKVVAAGGRGAAAASPAVAPPAVDLRRLERAERFKNRGNELFRAGKFAEALAEYSRAVNEHADNPIYYNNRAMACLKIFRFEQAEEDCNRALKFILKEADKAKALLRRATARTALQKYPEAERDLRQVLAVEPNNRQAREDLQNLQQMKADMAAAQQRMVAEFQAQRMMAAGAAPGAPPAGAAGAGRGWPAGAGPAGGAGFLPPPGFLPPGLDPSTPPPGFDWSQLAAAGGPEAFMEMMGGGGADGPGSLGPMFGGGRGRGR